tara:strand:+ start:4919 stop:5323 length:405 start_codon:yes stop_codon:yes gene_type:complete
MGTSTVLVITLVYVTTTVSIDVDVIITGAGMMIGGRCFSQYEVCTRLVMNMEARVVPAIAPKKTMMASAARTCLEYSHDFLARRSGGCMGKSSSEKAGEFTSSAEGWSCTMFCGKIWECGTSDMMRWFEQEGDV